MAQRDTVIKTVRNYRFWLVVALFIVGVILHYPQQLIGLEAPSSFLGLSRHTIERVYLLAPIIYSSFVFGLKGGITSLAFALAIMLPRAIIFSASPDEALVESIGIIAVGILVNLLFHMRRREQERTRISDALIKTEEEKWRSSFNALEDVMLIIDRNYNIENINDSGLTLLGKSRDQVIGKKCYQVLRGTKCPQEECPCRQTLETRQVGSLDHYEPRFDRYFSIKSSPIFDENGEIVKFVDLLRDITELKRAEEMLAKIIDGSPISMFVIDRDHRVTHWNTALEALAGLTREEIVGTSEQWRAFYNEKRPTLADLIVDGASAREIERYYQGKCWKSPLIGGAYEVEDYFPALGSGGKWLHFTASPIRNPSGEIIATIETLQDVTERKQAEEMLAKIIDGASVSIFVIDRDHRVTHWNTALEALTGLKRDKVVGTDRHWRAFYSKKSPTLADLIVDNASAEEIERYYQGKCKRSALIDGAYENEEPYPVPTKDDKWLLIAASPVKNLSGEAVAAIETLHDITDRKKAEWALQESEKSYRELFEVALDAIWVNDTKGNILKANKAAEKLTGLSNQELAQSNVETFLGEDCLRQAKDISRRLLKDETQTQPYEQHLTRKDGTEATVMLTTSPILSNGRLTAFQNIARDITEQKRMQENLRFYLQEITRAQEEERRRIARELHDSTLQTLIALLHQLENLLGDKAALPVREAKALWGFYEAIRDVVREVRRFSRDLRPSILDDLGLLPALEWLTGELTKEYGVETSLKVTGSEFRFSPEAELVLFRIVQEALRNIAKHAQANRAEVKVEFDKHRVRTTISDDGVGFELPESLGDLVQTGKLGLAGMQERMQLLGGSLKLKPKVGKGTTIVVDVPI
ncbi:MAG: PAS domain S-box protein [Dehalococcoidales bacterium]|nr:PAS domain S-box protein [Dehalococcoidales bacterium]